MSQKAGLLILLALLLVVGSIFAGRNQLSIALSQQYVNADIDVSSTRLDAGTDMVNVIVDSTSKELPSNWMSHRVTWIYLNGNFSKTYAEELHRGFEQTSIPVEDLRAGENIVQVKVALFPYHLGPQDEYARICDRKLWGAEEYEVENLLRISCGVHYKALGGRTEYHSALDIMGLQEDYSSQVERVQFIQDTFYVDVASLPSEMPVELSTWQKFVRWLRELFG